MADYNTRAPAARKNAAPVKVLNPVQTAPYRVPFEARRVFLWEGRGFLPRVFIIAPKG